MVRAKFAGRPGDSIVSLFSLGRRQVLALPADANGDPTAVTLTVWDAPDGTQLTDLLAADGSTAITAVVVPIGGQIPEFYGPDGVLEVYLKDPEGDFTRLDVGPEGPAGVADDASMTAVGEDEGSDFRAFLSATYAGIGAVDHGDQTGAVAVSSLVAAGHEVTLNGNVTITPSGPLGSSMVLRLVQDETGGRTVAFTGVTMPDGWAMPTDVDASTVVTLFRWASGWIGYPAPIPDPPIEVTPTAPTFTDASGTASDEYTIPTAIGVNYYVGGVLTATGDYAATGTVTITAAAEAGYILAVGAPSSWSHTFSTSLSYAEVTPAATHYWPLGEAAGSSTVASETGAAVLTVGTGVVLGEPGIGDRATCARFDGVGTALTVPVLSTYDTAMTAYSVEALVNLDVAQAAGNNWTVVANGASINLNLYNTNQVATNKVGILNGVAWGTGTTFHVVVTWDGANVRVYVNGVLKATAASATAVSAPTGNLSIGGTGYKGRIAGVKLYKNTALTLAQCLAHAQAAGLA